MSHAGVIVSDLKKVRDVRVKACQVSFLKTCQVSFRPFIAVILTEGELTGFRIQFKAFDHGKHDFEDNVWEEDIEFFADETEEVHINSLSGLGVHSSSCTFQVRNVRVFEEKGTKDILVWYTFTLYKGRLVDHWDDEIEIPYHY